VQAQSLREDGMSECELAYFAWQRDSTNGTMLLALIGVLHLCLFYYNTCAMEGVILCRFSGRVWFPSSPPSLCMTFRACNAHKPRFSQNMGESPCFAVLKKKCASDASARTRGTNEFAGAMGVRHSFRDCVGESNYIIGRDCSSFVC
jgi:hypothetical protein